MEKNNDPLYKTVHWRYFSNTAKYLCKYEGGSVTDYDFKNICCYTCLGCELQGSNVSYATNNNYSCWVDDNHYDYFEVPAVKNTKNYEGEYLFLAHNTDFDYWLFGDMEYTINQKSTKKAGYVVDNIVYNPCGKYDITITDKATNPIKTEKGRNCTFGGKSTKGKFDQMGTRKKAYHTSSGEIVAKSEGKTHNSSGLEGGETVKIYKKKPYKKK